MLQRFRNRKCWKRLNIFVVGATRMRGPTLASRTISVTYEELSDAASQGRHSSAIRRKSSGVSESTVTIATPELRMLDVSAR